MGSAPSEHAGRAKTEFARIGRDIVAPFLADFVIWLHQEAKRDGVTQLCFLARDGYLLQKAYDICIPGPERLPNTYMYASRRLFNIAAIEKLDDRLLQLLTDDHASLSVGEYLGRVGLDAARYSDKIQDAGFTDATEIVSDATRARLHRLFTSIEDALVAHARSERDIVKKYARGIADWGSGTVGIVDVGWRGSLQRSLARILDLPSGSLHGYYVGMHYGASDAVSKGYLDESRGADLRTYQQTIRRSLQVFELILAEPDGSIIGLQEDASQGFVPLRRGSGVAEDKENIALLQAAALDALAAMQADRPRDKARALSGISRLLSSPTAIEAAVVGELKHQEGLGECGRYEPLARPRMSLREYTSRHPWQFVEDLRWSYWRRGFITRLWSGE